MERKRERNLSHVKTMPSTFMTWTECPLLCLITVACIYLRDWCARPLDSEQRAPLYFQQSSKLQVWETDAGLRSHSSVYTECRCTPRDSDIDLLSGDNVQGCSFQLGEVSRFFVRKITGFRILAPFNTLSTSVGALRSLLPAHNCDMLLV